MKSGKESFTHAHKCGTPLLPPHLLLCEDELLLQCRNLTLHLLLGGAPTAGRAPHSNALLLQPQLGPLPLRSLSPSPTWREGG